MPPGSKPPPSPPLSPPARLRAPRWLRGPAFLRSFSLQHEGAHPIHRASPARADDAGRFRELHYGRSDDFGSLAQLLAVEHRHLLPLPVEVDLSVFGLRLALRRRLLRLRFLDRYGGDEPEVHQLDRLVIHPVSVTLIVGGVEALF